MSKLRLFSLLAAIAAIAIALGLFATRRPPGNDRAVPERRIPTSAVVAPGSSGRESPIGTVVDLDKPSKFKQSQETEGLTPEQLKPVRIRAGQALAVVNGVNITGKDVLPFRADDPYAEQSMTSLMLEFLLNQAIDRELTFQAARAQGIELTDQQRRQLDELRRTIERRFGGDPALVVNLDMAGTREDQIEFRMREATATMLMASLLDRAGAPSPFVTEDQVRESYNNHAGRYGVLPSDPQKRQEAWDQIDFQIRLDLAFPTSEHYSQLRLDHLQQLKSIAQIERYQPGS